MLVENDAQSSRFLGIGKRHRTLRISSVPNRLRKIPESIALTEPMHLRGAAFADRRKADVDRRDREASRTSNDILNTATDDAEK